jgi:ribosomal protein L40E
MKENYLVSGIVALIIGGVMFFSGYTIIGEYQTFAGQLSRFLFGSAQTQYMLAILIAFFGIILAILGLGLIMYGTVAKKGNNLIEISEGTLRDAQRQISLYFQYCPLCYTEGSVLPNLSVGGTDYIVCSKCAAKWHIYYVFSFKWAKLEVVNIDGKGAEYLNIEYPPEFWQRMALQGVRARTPAQPLEQTKKIYCIYCGTENSSFADFCQKCGKKIWGV